MVLKWIIAHFMHESEEHEASLLMTNVTRTDSYLLGEIDESLIPELESKGVIVQVQEEKPRVETPGRSHEVYPGVERPSPYTMLASTGLPPLQDPLKPRIHLISLRGPLLEEWRRRLEDLDVKLLEYIPVNTYTAKLTKEQVRAVYSLEFVSKLVVYGNDDKGPTRVVPQAPIELVKAPSGKILTYDVRLHSEDDMQDVVSWLQENEVKIVGKSGKKIRIRLPEDSTLAGKVASLLGVADIKEYRPPWIYNDITRSIIGLETQVAGQATIKYKGKGQIVAVADTGIDQSHPDFNGRIIGIVAFGRPNDPSDPHGHGTHVAGSILGDGAASNGAIKGTAPEANLYFQSILDSHGGLGGLPLDLGQLFDDAYKMGARIHNNSWGASTESQYTIDSREVDEFVDTHRDMLLVFAAGNEGQASVCLHTQKGYTDWFSIGSPASAKNALTVGASRSSRTSGGYSQNCYGEMFEERFPSPPIADEKISGDPECLAGFSGRGPCDDRRIKPDIVAPGTDIASTRSSSAPLWNYWGPYPKFKEYAFMGGTSMSSPIVAGCAALVRQYYVDGVNHDPSAALLKATIINGTRWLRGVDAVIDHGTLPNHHQGFGCIYLPWTIPNAGEPLMKLNFVDNWKDPPSMFNGTGQRFRYRFQSTDKYKLRVCLAWTDTPGRGLQNNLNLFLQNEDTGDKWMGNMDLPSGLKIPDPDNPVEVIRLDAPDCGNYLIQVTATNLLKTPQDFALVVTGEVTSLNRV